jgi:photosystem II stability/assembly factor-like uncharacterized protein
MKLFRLVPVSCIGLALAGFVWLAGLLSPAAVSASRLETPQAASTLTLSATLVPTAVISPSLTLTPKPTFTSTPTATPPPGTIQYLPLIANFHITTIELAGAWTADAQNATQQAFLLGSPLYYHASGVNNLTHSVDANLSWSQDGPCGTAFIFNGTVTLPPGDWEYVYPTLAPDCAGIFTATVQVTYAGLTPALSTSFVVNTASIVYVEQHQGFDRCYFPSVEDMQTWWDHSPYWVFNLYLGGISYACKDQPLDAFWVHQVALQGWRFSLAWVGPQAPCTNYQHRMSANPSQAYSQGLAEADLAAAAAAHLGFLGDMIIYYDMEGFTGASDACRDAVGAFMSGWTARLHALGFQAGGYGGACSSYVSDWASLDAVPDDVWIAHWIRTGYDPDVTVFGAPCVLDTLWANHQRIKQYAGGHSESWGGVSLSVDDNVLDGQATAILGMSAAPSASSAVGSTEAPKAQLSVQGPALRAAGLLSPTQGWALVADRLLWTDDGGASWRDLSPPLASPYRILGVAFRAPMQAWLVIQALAAGQPGALYVLRSQDGNAWQSYPLPLAVPQEAIEEAYLDLRTEAEAALVLKLPSGSSFSLGRLFVTQDGGRTWQERSSPLGEPVQFLDALDGWTAGGAPGDLLYHTADGGFTWQLQVLPIPPGSRAQVGLPASLPAGRLALPAALTGPDGHASLAWFISRDGGSSWSLESSLPLAREGGLGPLSPLGLARVGGLRAYPPAEGLPPAFSAAAPQAGISLPEGASAVDFLDGQYGWALVQTGACQGQKQPDSVNAQPLHCELRTQLLATADGGRTWREVTVGNGAGP